MATPDLLSPQIAVARLKKYLTNDEHRIRLHDLLMGEVERVHEAISGPRFPMDAPKDVSSSEALLFQSQITII